jgi:hypothetical protein
VTDRGLVDRRCNQPLFMHGRNLTGSSEASSWHEPWKKRKLTLARNRRAVPALGPDRRIRPAIGVGQDFICPRRCNHARFSRFGMEFPCLGHVLSRRRFPFQTLGKIAQLVETASGQLLSIRHMPSP